MAARLEGLRIVVPESRELDVFAELLERQGARALRCPLVTILDLEDAGPAERWLRLLAGEGFDDLVLFTGEGVRRLMGVAARSGMTDAVQAGFGRARRIVRGPKPVRALREIGLDADISAEAPTSEGILATLAGLSLAGRRVGLQSYPGQDDTVETALRAAGASVARVTPYRYASHEEDLRVVETVDAMASGDVELIAFTSRPQVARLLDVAARHGRSEALNAAMARTRVAAVGPVVGSAVEAAGWRVDVVPDTNFHMKPMILAISALFAAESVNG